METQKGIYLSPDNTQPNRDRLKDKGEVNYSKEEMLEILQKTLVDINELITITSSVESGKKLIKIAKVIQSAIDFINK